jgi:GntR family transcriptional repressor for pyruvate dehydrogenase complex
MKPRSQTAPVKTSPVPQNRRVDTCVARILALIREGRLTPGQRLGEGMLAKLLDMGKAPVKMALDQLAFAGVVERRPRSGSYVAEWSMRDYLQIMQLRAGLEAMAASLAAKSGDTKMFDALAAMAKNLDAMIEPYLEGKVTAGEVYKMEIEFHTAVAEASGNRYILRSLADQRVLAECVRAWIERPPAVHATPMARDVTHVSVVRAIRSRDPEAAGHAMRQHILTGLDPGLAGD